MDKDHIKRMYREAKKRIHDGNILSRNIDKQSDSDAFLRILGFEILLKCTLKVCKQQPKNNHNYYNLWLGLPGHVQKEIIKTANERMAKHTNFNDLEKLLKSYQFIFEKARYFYELYEEYSLEEQHELGKFWVEKLGAPTEEADVQYYPLELECLIHGLSSYIERIAF